MRNLRLAMALAMVVLSVAISACGSSNDDDGSGVTVKESAENGRMLGPHGEQSTLADKIKLSDAEVEKLRNGNYTAAVAWPEAASDVARGATKGVQDRFKELGIKVVAITDAGFDAAKQRNDIESILARKPDGLISLPVDATTTAPAFKTALKRGVKLSFLDQAPTGFKTPQDYVAIGTSDQIKTGEDAAKIIGEAMGGKGNLGMVFYDADFLITNQRDAAFEKALKKNYPNIKIVAKAGFEDPAKSEQIANAMITRNPNLDGIYTTWAEPAEGVLSALRQAGRDDIKVVSVDLSQTLALDMARHGPTAGVAVDRIVDGGRLQADLIGYGLLGKKAPPLVVTQGFPVTRDNLLDAWQTSYGEQAPKAIQDAMAKG